ncbi:MULTISPECIES: hypothetical protein [Methylomicrobium]|uniref:Uncharacterized protein n=1 Tax=Methylomicrobium album BG8 TaxID=686340 RepID=H8GG78_METAL|nr:MULTISPECIES: hypothetical protein [Methylomicrobium]EIC30002.1 hypothetical protein Metal_2262 [Methylomicrobium album BG8]
MTPRLLSSVAILFAAMTRPGWAESFSLPLSADYSLIKNTLVSQLFTGPDASANVWKDRQGCSFVQLSNPQLDGQNGQVHLTNNVHVRFGSGMNGQCLPLLEWSGLLETWQRPTIDPQQTVLSLPVTQARAYDRSGVPLNIDQLQDLLRRYAEPQLASLKIDLNRSRGDIERKLAEYLPKENEAELHQIISTLKFTGAAAKDEGISVTLGFDAPAKPLTNSPAGPLSAAEQQQWQETWQEWDAFFSKAIQQASFDSNSEQMRDTLTEILLEARSAFQAAIKGQQTGGKDPVRVFFTDTWERLAPELHNLAKQLPEIQGLRYMTFIAATDVIYQLESIGSPLGLEISSEGLRKLARILIKGQQERALSSPSDTPQAQAGFQSGQSKVQF